MTIELAATSTPLEIAHQFVQKTLDLAKDGHSAVLSMGENHGILSHQVSAACALKELVASGQQTTLFMEIPHNRLYTVLLDRGYRGEDALKLADHIQAHDTDGHITAKALIGGNANSLRGKKFQRFGTDVLLQTAIHHDVKIVYADAARVYPDDFCMDYSDPSTNKIALKNNARRGPAGEMGPDDMLIRNAHMSQTVESTLEKSGGVGLLQNGAAHGFGIHDEGNGLHHYRDSLAAQFQNSKVPSVMVSMVQDHALPPDYKNPGGNQRRIFNAPNPPVLTKDMTDSEISDLFKENGLEPNHYDPRKFAERYRADFDNVLGQAEAALPNEKALSPPSGLATGRSTLRQKLGVSMVSTETANASTGKDKSLGEHKSTLAVQENNPTFG